MEYLNQLETLFNQIHYLKINEIVLLMVFAYFIAYYFRSKQTLLVLGNSNKIILEYQELHKKHNEITKLQNENFRIQDLNNALRATQKKLIETNKSLKIDSHELKALQAIKKELKNVNKEDKNQVGSTTKKAPVAKKEEPKNTELANKVGEDGFFELD